MSHLNPTPLRVGMSGTFVGKSYYIVARVVMGVEYAGETYYWNEFYLSDGSDRIAILVCEEVYGAQQWRLFTEFTPVQPLSVSEAAALQVGARVNLDGLSAAVTVVSESKVYFIEGKAPNWLAVGETARYFNAEAGGKMWVVSWTGSEVEFYRGMQLHPEWVARGLGLSMTAFRPASSSGGQAGGSGGGWGIMLFTVVVVMAVACFFLIWNSGARYPVPYRRGLPPQPQPVTHVPPPPPPFAVGAKIKLDGLAYHVVTHRVTTLTKVNAKWDEHRYEVADPAGKISLLAVRVQSRGTDWMLMKPLAVARPPTPAAAAALRVGDKVKLDGFDGTVIELMMSQDISSSGPPIAGLAAGGVTYHYLAAGSNGVLLASWNGDRILFHLGHPPVR